MQAKRAPLTAQAKDEPAGRPSLYRLGGQDASGPRSAAGESAAAM
jgi:hypothetical protein